VFQRFAAAAKVRQLLGVAEPRDAAPVISGTERWRLIVAAEKEAMLER
jgi:hypothetical protein